MFYKLPIIYITVRVCVVFCLSELIRLTKLASHSETIINHYLIPVATHPNLSLVQTKQLSD